MCHPLPVAEESSEEDSSEDEAEDGYERHEPDSIYAESGSRSATEPNSHAAQQLLQVGEQDQGPSARLHAAGDGPSMSSDLSGHDVAPGSSDTYRAPVELLENSMDIEQSEIESISEGSGVETCRESESDLVTATESEQEGTVASSTFAVLDVAAAAAAAAALAAAFATPTALDVQASQTVEMAE